MKKKGISVVIAIIILAIIAVFIIDYNSKRPDRQGANPYEYNVDEYKHVEKELIHYKETKNFPVRNITPRGIDIGNGKICLLGDGILQVISLDGIQEFKKDIAADANCLEVTNKSLFIGFKDHIEKYSLAGEQVAVWDVPGLNCVFTSLAASGDLLYVADAGNRRVLIYGTDGELRGEFEGKAESSAGHGFIVPSAHFDLAVNSFDELWVVNPGKHALENYSGDGELRGFWQNSSMKIEGFTGCCNPAEIAVLPDGSFVTSEKGMVRIKIYDPSGKMISVVAAPDKFDEEGRAPEIAVDENGTIYALDFDRRMIRVFEKL